MQRAVEQIVDVPVPPTVEEIEVIDAVGFTSVAETVSLKPEVKGAPGENLAATSLTASRSELEQVKGPVEPNAATAEAVMDVAVASSPRRRKRRKGLADPDDKLLDAAMRRPDAERARNPEDSQHAKWASWCPLKGDPCLPSDPADGDMAKGLGGRSGLPALDDAMLAHLRGASDVQQMRW